MEKNIKLENLFVLKNILKQCLLQFLIKKKAWKKIITKKERVFYYYKQELMKKNFLKYKKKLIWDFLYNTANSIFHFWNKDFSEVMNHNCFFPFFQQFEKFFDNMSDLGHHKINLNFDPLSIFLLKIYEKSSFFILKFIKKVFHKTIAGGRGASKKLVFEAFEFYFNEFSKVCKFNVYFSQTVSLKNSFFLKVFKISCGKISIFWFFFWKLQFEIFLIIFNQKFFNKISKKELTPVFLISKFSKLLKLFSLKISNSFCIFFKIYWFDNIIGKFFFFFFSSLSLFSKKFSSEQTVFVNSNFYIEKLLEWISLDKKNLFYNQIINRKYLTFRKFSSEFNNLIGEFSVTLKNLKITKTGKNVVKELLSEKEKKHLKEKNQSLKKDFLFFNSKKFQGLKSQVFLEFLGFVLSQFLFDLFKFLKKANSNKKGRKFFHIIFFYTCFFLI